MAASFAGLDLLATAVVVLDDDFMVRYANPAAENLLTTGARSLIGQPFLGFSPSARTSSAPRWRRASSIGITRRATSSTCAPGQPVPPCTVTRIDAFGMALLAELRPISEQLRIEREARIESEQQANRELIRNLSRTRSRTARRLRGSAQLLEREPERPELREYTQVIIKEADRCRR